MSGGHFDYNQYRIGEIADKIEEEVSRATGPKPPLVTKEYVSVYRVFNDNSKSSLSFKFSTFNSALKEFMNPMNYDVLERSETTVKVKGKYDGHIYEVHSGSFEEYEDGEYYPNYSEETIKEFKKGIDILRQAEIYAQRIDWLISGDDGEETFHKRLRKDLANLKNNI